jgi:hypothetical protein
VNPEISYMLTKQRLETLRAEAGQVRLARTAPTSGRFRLRPKASSACVATA